MELINGKGDFNKAGLDEFVQETNLYNCGVSYAIIAIMGPQSSGKRTLLNHIFHANFREMDASPGRNQTTQGIWMEKCGGVKPFVVAMDLEGTDGSERGEDDTAFEKQSARFAWAIADIVIINMWCDDVGREHAANKPLLRTVFQAMMNTSGARKTTRLFVLRDKTRTPLHYFEQNLSEAAEKIWDSVHKPTSHIDTPFSEFFKVEVVALSSYEYNVDLFKEEVAQLRQRLLDCVAGDRQDGIPASGFSVSAQHIWKRIKENKDLDLPSHKVMVATIRCEEIFNEKLQQLSSNKDWLALEEAIQSGPVSSFGIKLSSILETCFGEYDKEAFYFDEGVRNEKGKQLQSKALNFAHPTYLKLLENLRLEALNNFKDELLDDMLNKESIDFAASAKARSNSALLKFDQACAEAAIRHVNWDTSQVREKLFQDIDPFKSSVREEAWSKWKVRYEQGLDKAVESLFEYPNQHTWAKIREFLTTETSKMAARISFLEIEPKKSSIMIQDLRDYARNVVERKAKEKAQIVLKPMKTKFAANLCDALERKKGTKRSIKKARTESLRLLSVMAAMRLDEKPDEIKKKHFSSLLKGKSLAMRLDEKPDEIKKELFSSLLKGKPLTLSTWPKVDLDGCLLDKISSQIMVSPENTLITPAQCNSLWEEFRADILHPTLAFTQEQGQGKGSKLAIAKLVGSIGAS